MVVVVLFNRANMRSLSYLIIVSAMAAFLLPSTAAALQAMESLPPSTAGIIKQSKEKMEPFRRLLIQGVVQPEHGGVGPPGSNCCK